MSIMAQWCLPSRRQQAGKVESRSAESSGLISEMLKSRSSAIAEA
jgi:hypothetical protein